MSRRGKIHILRELILANGGIMKIIPDILKSKSFHGWTHRQIQSLIYPLRKAYTANGEVWALHHGIIYARESDMPPEIWKEVCDRRAIKISGVADENRVYEERYKKLRQEKEAQKVLMGNIRVLGQTMQSSLKVVKTLDELDDEGKKEE